MKISSSSSQTLHLSISNNNSSINNKSKNHKVANEDSNSLKKNDPLKNLMDQKEKIADARQKYLDNALSKNESPQSIKEKLAEYDKQISDIDKQINELKLEEQNKHIGNNDKDKKNDKAKNDSKSTNSSGNSKADTSNEMMNNLISISNNMSQAKVLSDQKASEAGEIKILECEIKSDEGRNPVGNVRRRKQVTKLQDNIQKIEKDIGDKLNPNISDNNLSNVVNKDEQNENSKEEKSAKGSDGSAKDSKLLQTIKNYKDNLEDKTQTNGQKLNSIA